jgi:hypothetical protein
MIINVKAAATRYGLSRFWSAKIHSRTVLNNFYAIFLNDIFTTFFTSFNIISCGITYDYSVFHFSHCGLNVDIFLQDSINEELNYISRSKNSRFFNFFFPFALNQNSIKTRLFKFRQLKTRKKFIKPSAVFFKTKTKNLLNSMGTSYVKKNYKLIAYTRRKIYKFLLYKFNINLHDNEFRTFSFSSSNVRICKIFNFNYPNTYKKSFRRNLAILAYFFKRYFRKIYLIKFSKRKRKFLNFSDPIIKIMLSNTFQSKNLSVYNKFSSDFFLKLNKTNYFLFFNNHKLSKKIFPSTFFKNNYRRNRIKYIKRRQKSKNFFFNYSFSSFFTLFNFYSKILKIYLLHFFPISNIKIYRLRYTNINVNAFVFYSAVKLYYKYLLNDVIRPLIRGVSRYYTGFFVLCKGRFTRAQIASKRVYRRNFVNYNRMHYPIYYSVRSVALRYGASTVHIWLQH